jgi:hypothetical protein
VYIWLYVEARIEYLFLPGGITDARPSQGRKYSLWKWKGENMPFNAKAYLFNVSLICFLLEGGVV